MELTKQRDVAYVYNGDKGYEITFKGTAALDAKALTELLQTTGSFPGMGIAALDQ